MKDIKTKECRRTPKLKDPMARMPKELMRDMVLNAKEKSHSVPEAGAPENGQETPVEYASRKVISAEERTADAVVRGTSSAGRILAEKSYERKTQKSMQAISALAVERNRTKRL